jgi:hypothetical protein
MSVLSGGSILCPGVPENVRTSDAAEAGWGSLRLEVAQGRCRKLLKLMSSRETARDGVQVVGGSNPLAPTNRNKGLGNKQQPFFFRALNRYRYRYRRLLACGDLVPDLANLLLCSPIWLPPSPPILTSQRRVSQPPTPAQSPPPSGLCRSRETRRAWIASASSHRRRS